MTRDQFLTERLTRFLTERRVAPRSLSSPAAQADEIKALGRIVLSRAPQDGFEEWWDEVETHVGAHAQTRAWPTEREMLAATAAARGPHGSGPRAPEWKLDPMAVAARKIRAGEAVGDGWIYGRQARELVAGGYVTEADLRPYKASLYHGHQAIYGHEATDAAVAEWQGRDEAARLVAEGDPTHIRSGVVVRPRFMSDAIRGPRDPGGWDRVAELTAEEIAARPWTDADRERAAARRFDGGRFGLVELTAREEAAP